MAYEDIANSIIGKESSGNPYARNPRSSAAGLGQFIDSTWLSMVKRHRPDVAQGRTDAQILQLKYDPSLSREMTERYAQDNAAFLQSRGVPATAGSLRLAHFAGPQGAAAVYANPDAPVESSLGRGAVAANPFLRGKSGADVIAWADRQMTPSGGAKAMAGNLQKRFAPKTEGGAVQVSGGAGAQAMAGGAGMDQLKSALSGKSYDPERLANYGNLAKVGQSVASQATGPAQALLGIATAGIGGYLQDNEKLSKKDYDTAFAEAVKNVQSPAELAQLLVASPDEKFKAAGLELLSKNLGQAPQTRTIEGPYGTKITQDYVGGQWVTQGGGSQPSPGAAPAMQGGGTVPPVPQGAVQPPAAPAPSPQPQEASAPTLPQLAQAGPSIGGSNTVAKTDMGAPAQPQQPAPAPQFRVGAAVPKAPDGFVHKLAPDGSGYLYGQDGQPIFENKAEADTRAKTSAERADKQISDARTAEQFAGGLQLLEQLPKDFGTQAFERAIGPYTANAPEGEGNLSLSVLGTGFSIPNPIRAMSQTNSEIERYFQGGARGTEVRGAIETNVKNLAAVMKPLVRGPGEGTWSDKDQANLEKQIGDLTRAGDVGEYNRGLSRIRETVARVLKLPEVKVEQLQRSANAPLTAEQEVTPWEQYRKKFLGY